MIVHVATFLSSVGGSIDKEHWLRPIPGKPGWAAYCRKPKYTKKAKQDMANRKEVQVFVKKIAAAKLAYHDPEQRALWSARHLVAKRKTSGRGKVMDTQGRCVVPESLWCYICRYVEVD